MLTACPYLAHDFLGRTMIGVLGRPCKVDDAKHIDTARRMRSEGFTATNIAKPASTTPQRVFVGQNSPIH
jgi:hypothetical protein